MYQIGDEVFYVTFDTSPGYATCPECGGTCRLTVTLFDGTEHSIDCNGCAAGYDPPTGKVSFYQRTEKVIPGKITGVEVKGDGFEYRVLGLDYKGCTYIADEDRIDSTEEGATEKARKLAEELDERDRKRALGKEKDHRTWSWNVHYYREQIRKAKKDLEYYTAKLEYGRPKANEERKVKKK